MTRYTYYQEVRIAHPASDNAEYAGLVGVVVGIGAAPGHPVAYGVIFAGREHMGSFEEHELAATGRQFQREDFYDDSKRIRVRVDKHGRGELA